MKSIIIDNNWFG